MDVQLAICCGPADRARKPTSPPSIPSPTHTHTRSHTGRMAFSNARARDSTRFPPGNPRHIPDTKLQMLSVGRPENILKWSDDSVRCICWCAERDRESGSGHSMVHSAAKDHYSSLSGAKSSGCSTPLQMGKSLPDRVTGGLSTGPKETHWHSTAGVMC